MELTLIVFGGLSLLELIVTLPGVWKLRRQLAALTLIGLAAVTGWLAVTDQAVWGWLLAVLNVYRVVNLLRFAQDRSQPDYLRRTGRQASLGLISLQGVILLLAWFQQAVAWPALTYEAIGLSVSLIIAGILLTSTLRHLRTLRPPQINEDIASRDLPSLTVAIPARNETTDLKECLQSLLTSNYPKLEILVLDDCSQNKRTPEIIRSFAHDGVRFIAGDVPPEHWLAKNYAYHRLMREANGELLLFCGVDVRFTADSLRLLVETMLHKKKTMISVMPQNLLPGRQSWRSLLAQPGRYAWEIALPRRLFKYPPALSTCWLINVSTLRKAGGFGAAARDITPEQYFANYAARHADGYSFLSSDAAMGIRSAKTYHEQLATAMRTRYPVLHRRPELVAALSLAELGALFAPLVLAIGAGVAGHWALATAAAVNCLLVIITYALVVRLTYRRFLRRSLLLALVAPLFDIGLMNYSMWQYEFGEVIWKGRNVCVPVMQTIPKLPPI